MDTPKTEIIVSKDGVPFARYIVEPGEYIIGRSSECPLIVDADLVSRRHARLTVSTGHMLIEDLGSSNGTLIDGEPAIGSVRVLPGQTLTIGVAAITFLQIEPAPPRGKKYDLGAMIGSSGAGAILDARETATDRTVAMKVIPDSASPDDLRRFVTEAKITGQLEHPNIVPVHELGVDAEGRVFYTMKRVRGITLQKVLALLADGRPGTIKKYPLGQLLTVFQKVCDAVAFAHSRGITHGDLKPGNVSIGDFGEVLVMDWSAADSATHDTRGDIRSLGAILYHILTLHAPVESHPAGIALPSKTAPVRESGASHLPGGRVPESLDAVTMKALSQNKAARYANVAALQSDIEAYQNGFATGAEQAGFVKQAMLLIRRNKAAAIAAAIIHVLVAIIMVQVISSRRSLQATMRQLKGAAPTFHAQAQALIERAPADDTALGKALENIEHAIDLAPESAAHHIMKGGILQTMQRLSEARAAFATAVSRDRENVLAKENLRLCEQLLHEQGSDATLAPASLGKLQEALQKQGRVPESLVLLHSLGTDKNRVTATWRAMLKNAGIDRQPGLLPDGSLALNLDNLPIDNLAFLNGMPLGDLSFSSTKVSDLSPLAAMPLKRLVFSSTNVVDLAPLQGLKLTELTLSAKVTDLAPLRGMKLEKLEIVGATGLRDISALQDTTLKRLNLSGSGVSDLSPLKGLPLTSLDISATPVSDLSAVAGMPLEELRAERCQDLRDLGPLAGVPLKSVHFNDSARITDVAPLNGAPLERADFSSTAVADVAPLAGTPVETLNLSRTPFADAAQLNGLPRLTSANLAGTAIGDLTPLAKSSVQLLNLHDCWRVSAAAPLARMSSLKAVGLPTHVSDAGSLRAMPGLQWIGFGNPPSLKELAGRTKDMPDFFQMLDAEKQARAGDASGRLHPGGFPQMKKRFPGARQFGKSWYAVIGGSLTWTGAKKLAEELGGHLVTIVTAEEDDFAGKAFGGSLQSSSGLWLGAQVDRPGGTWRWVTDEPWSFTHWGRDKKGVSQPNGTTATGQPETCLSLYRSNSFVENPAWNDLQENSTHTAGFIVEWDD